MWAGTLHPVTGWCALRVGRPAGGTEGWCLDLHGGRPYWLLRVPPSALARPLERDVRCDVGVIGSGITGALVADALVREGLSVIVVDKATPGHGSTAASTALLQYDLDVPLRELSLEIGTPAAERAFRIGVEALDAIGTRCAHLAVEFQRVRSLYLATRPAKVPDLRREFECRQQAGLRVEWAHSGRLHREFGVAAMAGILSLDAAQTDPSALCRALLGRAVAGGAALHAPAEVIGIERSAFQRVLVTKAGPTVRCTYVVDATGYEAATRLPDDLVDLDSTWAIATGPVPAASHRLAGCILWEDADPYLYARWDGDRLLIGGEDEEFTDPVARDALIASKSARLVEKFKALVPGVKADVTHAWAGTFATTPDGLGYIGPTPDDDRVLYALGFGGNGITMSAIAADVIVDRVMGRENRDAEMYRIGR